MTKVSRRKRFLHMLNKNRFLLSLPFICFTISSFAQQNITGQNLNVAPVSPVAASINKYGAYPVSKFTGVPEINIPLYEIVSGDIILPISISYHASGIKTTDQSYPVGIGWSLNAGGKISCQMRDKADDNPSMVPAVVLMQGVGTTQSIDNVLANGDDAPDIFSYNMGTKDGYSGKFMFDGLKRYQLHNKKLIDPVFFPDNDLKFVNKGSNSTASDVFALTDDKGKEFVYGIAGSGYLGSQGYWNLTEIIPASKQISDKVVFTYESGPTLYACTNEGSLTIIDSVALENGNDMDPYMLHFDRILGAHNTPSFLDKFRRIDNDGNKQVFVSNLMSSPGEGNGSMFYQQECAAGGTLQTKTIQFKGGTVLFSYNPTNGYYAGGLRQIKVLNSKNEIIRIVEFYYSTPERLWFPYTLQKLIIKGNETDIGQKYLFDYEDGPPNEGVGIAVGRDFWGYYNGYNFESTPVPRWENVPTLALYKYDGNHLYMNTDIGTANRECNPPAMKAYLIKKISYPTGGYSEFGFEPNQYFDNISQQEKIAGGFRVKTIKSYDGINQPLIKEYSYGIDDISGMGIPKRIPRYEDYVNERTMFYGHSLDDCQAPQPNLCLTIISGIYARRRDFLSSPKNEIAYNDGSSVWYTYVEETDKNMTGVQLGKTVYKYELPDADQKANESYYFRNKTIFLQSKYLLYSTGFNFPRLQEVSRYRSVGSGFQKIQSNEYIYGSRTQGDVYTWGSYLIQTFDEGMAPDPNVPPNNVARILSGHGAEYHSKTYKLVEEKTTDYSNGKELVSNKVYDYGSTKHYFPTTIATSGNQKYFNKFIKYPLDYDGLTGTDLLTSGIKNLQAAHIISAPVEEITSLYDATNTSSNGVIAANLEPIRKIVGIVSRRCERKLSVTLLHSCSSSFPNE